MVSPCIAGRPGSYVTHVPVILNGNRDSPYRTLTLRGQLLAPNLSFDPESVQLTPVPLGTQVSADFIITARGYRKYVTVAVFLSLRLCRISCLSELR